MTRQLFHKQERGLDRSCGGMEPTETPPRLEIRQFAVVPEPPGLHRPRLMVILADQVRSLDWRARRAEFSSEAPAGVVSEVLGKIQALLAP